mgnify:CR=1 FL=1
MKDLELLKVNIKTYFIVFAVGIIYLFVQTDGSIFFISYMIFVSLSVTVGTISYDSYHHGMNFLMTLPIYREKIRDIQISDRSRRHTWQQAIFP